MTPTRPRRRSNYLPYTVLQPFWRLLLAAGCTSRHIHLCTVCLVSCSTHTSPTVAPANTIARPATDGKHHASHPSKRALVWLPLRTKREHGQQSSLRPADDLRVTYVIRLQTIFYAAASPRRGSPSPSCDRAASTCANDIRILRQVGLQHQLQRCGLR